LAFLLEENGERLELRALHRHNYGAISADWTGAELRRRIAGGKRQPLARAAGLHKEPAPSVLDANAGLGRDGYTLAALGAHLTLVERNGSVVELLRDAHRRALADPSSRTIAQRIEIIHAEALAVFGSGREWDVVYLDPMYPDDGKTSLPGKEMQILRDLTGGDEDADQLLRPALACARQRVVVKRPPKAPWLNGVEPSMSLRSTQLRFDVYLKTARNELSHQ
jgi:16S rRNA (guanine1516-N2)-methyltransferase